MELNATKTTGSYSTNLCKNDIVTNLRDYQEDICDAICSVDPELAGLLVQKGIITNESELEPASKSQEKAQNGVNFERVESRSGEESVIFFGV